MVPPDWFVALWIPGGRGSRRADAGRGARREPRPPKRSERGMTVNPPGVVRCHKYNDAAKRFPLRSGPNVHSARASRSGSTASTRRWGARRARVDGPTPETRRRKSEGDANGRAPRSATIRRASPSPTPGSADKTPAGASLISRARFGTSRPDAPRSRSVHPATIRAAPAPIKTKANNPRPDAVQNPPARGDEPAPPPAGEPLDSLNACSESRCIATTCARQSVSDRPEAYGAVAAGARMWRIWNARLGGLSSLASGLWCRMRILNYAEEMAWSG